MTGIFFCCANRPQPNQNPTGALNVSTSYPHFGEGLFCGLISAPICPHAHPVSVFLLQQFPLQSPPIAVGVHPPFAGICRLPAVILLPQFPSSIVSILRRCPSSFSAPFRSHPAALGHSSSAGPTAGAVGFIPVCK